MEKIGTVSLSYLIEGSSLVECKFFHLQNKTVKLISLSCDMDSIKSHTQRGYGSCSVILNFFPFNFIHLSTMLSLTRWCHGFDSVKLRMTHGSNFSKCNAQITHRIEDKLVYNPLGCLCHKKSFFFFLILTPNDYKCPLTNFIYLFLRGKMENVANQE